MTQQQTQYQQKRFANICVCKKQLEDFNQFLCEKCRIEFYRDLTQEELESYEIREMKYGDTVRTVKTRIRDVYRGR